MTVALLRTAPPSMSHDRRPLPDYDRLRSEAHAWRRTRRDRGPTGDPPTWRCTGSSSRPVPRSQRRHDCWPSAPAWPSSSATTTARWLPCSALALTGRCDCGHHLRGCTGCGRGCCFTDHDLRSWDPYRCHLRPFVDQAVRGTAQRRILGGAFAASMLFRALEREGRILCRTVEWGRCDVCGRAFEGLHCPEPHPRQAGSVRREPRKNQLIAPADESGGHLPLQRWWCAECQHLYGAAAARATAVPDCPRCARRPSRRMRCGHASPRPGRGGR